MKIWILLIVLILAGAVWLSSTRASIRASRGRWVELGMFALLLLGLFGLLMLANRLF
jgi:hypothetical protein